MLVHHKKRHPADTDGDVFLPFTTVLVRRSLKNTVSSHVSSIYLYEEEKISTWLRGVRKKFFPRDCCINLRSGRVVTLANIDSPWYVVFSTVRNVVTLTVYFSSASKRLNSTDVSRGSTVALRQSYLVGGQAMIEMVSTDDGSSNVHSATITPSAGQDSARFVTDETENTCVIKKKVAHNVSQRSSAYGDCVKSIGHVNL